ncbi:lysM and putative peptidoglycan-binding domain-containing protein 1 [Hyla sarda]|uniref:lysM and putative peptidoglycan-binding domain-containing protein 1 n=1 Tax=Hyla sarda TaxID=327740 RepID=UPI0024C2EC47|nr:lysM and putative peptidoglycan-binding domain-containing protein 1 [Hyla sarda]
MASREGDSGLLRGSRARSYGSLVQTNYSPARVRKVDHLVQPGDTLQGLALKYGVTMEQIKRANRLYTNDSIFLKKYLSIPVPIEQPQLTNGEPPTQGLGMAAEKEGSRPQRSMSLDARKEDPVSVVDFMTKLDTRIRVSKRAAVKKMREVESVAQDEDSGAAVGYQGPREEGSPQTAQRSMLGPVPLTVTTRVSTLRDREDEIFKL